jgi:ribonuclease HI
MVKIVQVNLGKRSLAAVGLINLINTDNYEIALIQEPCSFKKNVCKMNKNGVTYENPNQNEDPRSCIWINKDLAASSEALQLLEFSDKDCVVVKLKLNTTENKRVIILCSAYFPGYNETRRNVICEKLDKLIKHCLIHKTELIVGCDANAHNIIWGSNRDCPRGNILLEYLTTQNLTLLNEGNSPTWERNELSDVIDITFSTQDINESISNWKVLTKDSHSDHNYISFELAAQQTERQRFRSKKKTNWAGYRASLSRLLDNPVGSIECINDLEREAEILTKAIVMSYHNNCKLTYKNTKCKLKWQTSEILEQRKQIRKHHNTARRRKTDEEAWALWRHKTHEYKKKCRKASSDCWRKEMTELENISDVARLQKFLENRSSKKLGNLKKIDGSYTNSSEENNIELLATHFPDCEIVTEELHETEIELNANFNSIADKEHIESVITMEKIHWVVNSFSPYKSAGEDKIFPALLQKAIDIIDDRLQILFKESLRLSYIPKSWRKTLVVFIPKVGKPTYEVARAYRPISLMSFILKSLEKLLDRNIRLNELELNKLNPKQFAYQQGKGTETALHDITTNIEHSLKHRGVALAVFIDIEGAFDNTEYNVIEQAARNKAINDISINWIKAMLANRIIKASTEESHTRIKPIKGCPQGGCLSPLLWCLVVDSLIYELTDAGCHVTAYADDLALVVNSGNAEEACDKMNNYMKILENWCARNKLSVNPAKTTMIRFTRCTSELKIRMKPVKLYGEELKREESFKYLGVHLDSKLKMNKQVEESVNKSIRSLWAARTMVARTWGLNPRTTSWLYKQIIMPRITYGSIIWWHRANLKTYATKFDKVHRLALLMITGAVRTTPTLGMSSALEILPINIVTEIRARECYERLKTAGTWNTNAEIFGHGEIANLNYDFPHEQLDNCARMWNFGNKFRVEILNRQDWNLTLNETYDPLVWYSDGSKTDNTTGSGIFCEEYSVNRSERLSDHSTVMQAETLAIKLCADEMIQRDIRNRNIFIFSDSQAALMAIAKSVVSHLTVKECINSLNRVATRNNLIISWVPGHSGVTGNEKADELANEGTRMANIGMETPISSAIKSMHIRNRGEKLFKDLWNNNRGLKHSKLMMEPFKKGKKRYLFNLKRRDLRVIIGILTGHSCLKKFLHRIGKAEDSYCRACNEDVDEDMGHLLTECPAFLRYRINTFGTAFPGEEELRKVKTNQILRFAKRTEIYESFFREGETT